MIIRTFETLDWRVKENTRISFQLHFNRYITTALLNKCYLVSIRNAINLFSKTNLTRLQSVHTLLTLGLTGSIHCIKAVRRIYCKLMTGAQTCQLLPRKASWETSVTPWQSIKKAKIRSGS